MDGPLETRLSGFMFFSTHKKNSEKSNRSNDQLPQSKCLQRWHRLAILVPGLGTNRLPTYDPLTLDEMRREKKGGEDFLGCLEQNMNKISGLNLNRWLGKKSLDKYDSSHHYQHLQRSAKMVLKGSQFTIPQGLIGTPLKVLVYDNLEIQRW